MGTKTLGNRSVQRTSYTLYDGFLRPRQTQDPGPDGGRLLTDTFYDERGLVSQQFATYYANGAPSTGLLKPADALSVETQSRYKYDGLGRQTEAKQIAGNGDGGPTLATTTTIYGGDRTTVIPPTGGTTTTTLVDARGQTTELRQHHTPSANSAYDSTKYTYTPRGELKRITDPAGNTWAYEYDLLGRQKVTTDPDKGTTTSTYDDHGQLTTTKDAPPPNPGPVARLRQPRPPDRTTRKLRHRHPARLLDIRHHQRRQGPTGTVHPLQRRQRLHHQGRRLRPPLPPTAHLHIHPAFRRRSQGRLPDGDHVQHIGHSAGHRLPEGRLPAGSDRDLHLRG